MIRFIENNLDIFHALHTTESKRDRGSESSFVFTIRNQTPQYLRNYINNHFKIMYFDQVLLTL